MKGVLCFYCVKAFQLEKSSLAKNTDPAFVSAGFRNWKKAVEKFTDHTKSRSHKLAVTTHCQKENPIDSQLSSALAASQQKARACLMKIMSCVQFLGRQGLALRGNESEEGNLAQLLRLRSDDDSMLFEWLNSRSHDYTSPQIQNEMLSIMANSIVRDIASEIRAQPTLQYSIIIDGTQDITGTEQESICLRYVDHNLISQEAFVGLYEVSLTTGQNLANVAKDVLLRLNLSLDGLRGQTYDGAANMSGKYAGAQAYLTQSQPLALFVHCGPHCVNLITQATCAASSVVRDALQWVHEVGHLFGLSGKFKTIFCNIATSEHGSFSTLKPLCPTRWTVRVAAVHSVLKQYEAVLLSLEEMASTGGSETATKANGLLDRFQRGNTVLGLHLALEVLQEMECLNKSLQKRTITVAGMQAAVDYVKTALQEKRTEGRFKQIFDRATELVTSLNISPIEMPRIRRPPKRLAGEVSAHAPAASVDYFRREFFQMLDTADVQFRERFHQASLEVLQKLENVLVTGKSDAIVDQYPEINRRMLDVQLAMFKSKNTYISSTEAADILRGMLPEVRGLFDQVEVLVRLLLVVPTSSAEAERSFSALRRLKTWLRNCMKQKRLNNVAVCHIHQERVDALDRKKLCQEFISASDRRQNVFGSFG